MQCFKNVLAEEGINLSKEDYYATYIGMDDRTCFRTVLEREKRATSPTTVEQLVARKGKYYQQAIAQDLVVLPGAKEFVQQASERYFLGIVSGALRSEIEHILATIGLQSYFLVVIAAEDVRSGKPHPEGYLKGLDRLNQKLKDLRLLGEQPLLAKECLAIEDAPPGIEAAHAAGMKCLAVTSSFSKEDLHTADYCVETLSPRWEIPG